MCLSVLQCVAVCCSVLQWHDPISPTPYTTQQRQLLPSLLKYSGCVAVHCSVLRCIAVCCGALQCVAVRCSALQCVAVRCSALQCVLQYTHTPAARRFKRHRRFITCALCSQRAQLCLSAGVLSRRVTFLRMAPISRCSAAACPWRFFFFLKSELYVCKYTASTNTFHKMSYGVALVSKIDKIIWLFCKRAL